jgi:hypothetical protein
MPASRRKTLMFIFGLILVLTAIFCYPSFSQEKKAPKTEWGHLQFSAEGGSHHFFDTSTGNIYEYSSSSGRLRHVWTLEELGKNYTQVQ